MSDTRGLFRHLTTRKPKAWDASGVMSYGALSEEGDARRPACNPGARRSRRWAIWTGVLLPAFLASVLSGHTEVLARGGFRTPGVLVPRHRAGPGAVR